MITTAAPFRLVRACLRAGGLLALGAAPWGSAQTAGPALPAGTRIAFTGATETPDHLVVFDGAHERGWLGHEAGLLRSRGVAFDESSEVLTTIRCHDSRLPQRQ